MDRPATEAWETGDQTFQYKVHLGLWTNWSRGSLGRTLTMTRAEGDLLIAFTAFFVAYVGSRFWRIGCLIAHQAYSTSAYRGAIHHQRQVMLRNTSTPDSGIVTLIHIAWAWRRLSYFVQLLPVIAMALFCAAGFTVAGGFSSQISTSTGSQVLLDGVNCGIMQRLSSGSNSVPFWSQNSIDINNALNYVQQCYSGDSSGLIDCKSFATQRISTYMNSTAACPFEDTVCRTSSNNLILDTGYINSHDDLGINAPPNERILFRQAIHCAPLETSGYKTSYHDEVAGDRVRYNYGQRLYIGSDGLPHSRNFSYQVKTVESQYNVAERDVINAEYKIDALHGYLWNGTFQPSLGNFFPDPELARHDADTSVLLLSGNGVFSLAPIDDPWYRAKEAVKNSSIGSYDPTEHTLYIPDEAASPLGCAEQYQFCFTDKNTCGPFDSYINAIAGAFEILGIDPMAWVDETYDVNQSPAVGRLAWFTQILMLSPTDLPSIFTLVGSQALDSKRTLFSGLQSPLAPDQWQRDIEHAWMVNLALLQSLFVKAAHGAPETDKSVSLIAPVNDAQRNLCANQKIRSTFYASFNFFGLLFTYVVGLVIIGISLSLEPLLGLIQKWRGWRTYSYLEWITNATFHLQRLAYESMEEGKWTKCDECVPITEEDPLLTSLDISDKSHPKLSKRLAVVEPSDKPSLATPDADNVKGAHLSETQEQRKPEQQPLNRNFDTNKLTITVTEESIQPQLSQPVRSTDSQ